MLQMVSHQLPARPRNASCTEEILYQNVGAVALRFHHVAEAAHLALDAREPLSTVALIAGSTPAALRPVSQAQVVCGTLGREWRFWGSSFRLKPPQTKTVDEHTDRTQGHRRAGDRRAEQIPKEG